MTNTLQVGTIVRITTNLLDSPPEVSHLGETGTIVEVDTTTEAQTFYGLDLDTAHFVLYFREDEVREVGNNAALWV